MKKQIDINADMGESFGVYKYGADSELMPYITSANIACGFHGGDPHVMRETVQLATSYGVRIGAHVGFPDKLGFGRREINVTPQEVYDYVLYQLGALDGFLKANNTIMSHMKLHGALYMMACSSKALSQAAVQAVADYNPHLDIYALPSSELAVCSEEAGLKVMNEYFADRPYTNGQVKMFNWDLSEIGSPQKISETIVRLLEKQLTTESANTKIDTICVHSDTPNAALIAKCIHQALQKEERLISL